ncbi:MAG: acryloyl-CoA reductase [Sporolactobacillus sp.]
MTNSFRALVVNKQGKEFSVGIQQLTLDDLPKGEVLIRVCYSGVNYKDSLAAVPDGNIVRSYPFVPGIDLAGLVIASEDARFKAGDQVIATSYGIGVTHFGGYSEIARIPADWIVPLPSGLSLKEAMIIGTAGFTAALSVQRLEENQMEPGKGKVLVTGATGGVGSFAVAILSARGYIVEASTGKKTATDYLRAIGAATVIDRSDVYQGTIKALQRQKWAAAVDSVGGDPLAALLSQIQYGGSVAACGLTAGTQLRATVFPFILRGINLLGIDSAYCPMSVRQSIWRRLAGEFKPSHLENFIQNEVTLDQLPGALPTLLKGEARGRTLVKLNQ